MRLLSSLVGGAALPLVRAFSLPLARVFVPGLVPLVDGLVFLVLLPLTLARPLSALLAVAAFSTLALPLLPALLTALPPALLAALLPVLLAALLATLLSTPTALPATLGFFLRELMSTTGFLGRPPALGREFALAIRVHVLEALAALVPTFRVLVAIALVCHSKFLSSHVRGARLRHRTVEGA